MQLSQDSSLISEARLHTDVLKLCPTCNINFNPLKVKALFPTCEQYCAIHKEAQVTEQMIHQQYGNVPESVEEFKQWHVAFF
jgi:hypothetical protein